LKGNNIIFVLSFCLDACELAELLLSKGAYVDPMWEKRTPLYIACQRGNARMMEILLQHQADVTLFLLIYAVLMCCTLYMLNEAAGQFCLGIEMIKFFFLLYISNPPVL
jgi:ankyrin repeat protein